MLHEYSARKIHCLGEETLVWSQIVYHSNFGRRFKHSNLKSVFPLSWINIFFVREFRWCCPWWRRWSGTCLGPLIALELSKACLVFVRHSWTHHNHDAVCGIPLWRRQLPLGPDFSIHSGIPTCCLVKKSGLKWFKIILTKCWKASFKSRPEISWRNPSKSNPNLA